MNRDKTAVISDLIAHPGKRSAVLGRRPVSQRRCQHDTRSYLHPCVLGPAQSSALHCRHWRPRSNNVCDDARSAVQTCAIPR